MSLKPISEKQQLIETLNDAFGDLQNELPTSTDIMETLHSIAEDYSLEPTLLKESFEKRFGTIENYQSYSQKQRESSRL